MSIISKLKKRAKEPSTQASLAVLLGLAGTVFPAYQAVIWSVAGLFGLGGVVIPEVASKEGE